MISQRRVHCHAVIWVPFGRRAVIFDYIIRAPLHRTVLTYASLKSERIQMRACAECAGHGQRELTSRTVWAIFDLVDASPAPTDSSTTVELPLRLAALPADLKAAISALRRYRQSPEAA
jgi:hypothetical protein